MPARSERIRVFPGENGQPGWILRFPVWWDRDAFFEQFLNRQIDLGNPIDWNFVWVLTAADAVSFNERCQERFSSDPRGRIPAVVEEMRRLDAALGRASWVLVESYEWESGLD
jgi:hypothetical protein